VEALVTAQNSPDQPTPLSLLQRARANDAEAWTRLVRLYQPLVLFWCSRARCPAAETEDVAQEVFAAAHAGLGRFRRDRPGDSFRAWLRGITRNQVLLHYRRNQHHPQAEGGSDVLHQLQAVPDVLAEPLADEPAEVTQLYRRALEQVRSHFEDATWSMFWLTVIEDRSPTALAAELGVTPAAVRQAKSRVLRRLKQELGELLD
jgi:RNA polymerase sigma-70 factor, ECF subfamily